jgi:hypothetical protein
MQNLTRGQRLLLTALGILLALIFLALTVYWAVAAPGHPRVKHMLLFIVLAVLSALVAWFAFPTGPEYSRRL